MVSDGTVGIREVKLAIEGRDSVRATFDLGAGSSILISREYWERERLLEGRRSSETIAGGVGGMTVRRAAMLRSVSFGGQEFRDVPAIFNEAATELPAEGVNLGMGILRRFHMAIDYSRNALWLTADSASVNEPFSRNRAGVSISDDSLRQRIEFIASGSPAERAGWRVGDEIVAVNDVRIDRNFVNTTLSRWYLGAAGTVVRLTMTDGTVRTLTLADYY